MTSACLLDEAMNSNDDVSNDVITISSCEEKRKSWISDDEVSSDVITISSCEEKRKSWISDDDVSSDVITINRELQCNQLMILEISDSKTMSFG
ncbi:hypothetical protein F511_39663 [Dorcoceras hygrometricum]|uniref:Uncharacterized protein n=1 Tax=Dorcoceras hygrometricum TaxID=472368 RepID=A0A2Z7CGL3_9LAMI|nr:hypothetical protein F511_39663 [Dorcoceras hygrometricum]